MATGSTLATEAAAFLDALRAVLSRPVQLRQLMAHLGAPTQDADLRALAQALRPLVPDAEGPADPVALFRAYQALKAQLAGAADLPADLQARLLPFFFARFIEVRHPVLHALAGLLGAVAADKASGGLPLWNLERAWAALSNPKAQIEAQVAALPTPPALGSVLFARAASLCEALGLPLLLTTTDKAAPAVAIPLGAQGGLRLSWSEADGVALAPYGQPAPFKAEEWALEWRDDALHAAFFDEGRPVTLQLGVADGAISVGLESGPGETTLMEGLTVAWQGLGCRFDLGSGESSVTVDGLAVAAGLGDFWGGEVETKLSLRLAFHEGAIQPSSTIDFAMPALGKWPLSAFDFDAEGRKLELEFPAGVLGSFGLLPLVDGTAHLSLGANEGGGLTASFSLEMEEIAVNLGSPLARLRLGVPATFSMSTEEGVSLTLAEQEIKGALELDLFDKLMDGAGGGAGNGAVVGSTWGAATAALQAELPLLLKLPFTIPIPGAAPAAPPVAAPLAAPFAAPVGAPMGAPAASGPALRRQGGAIAIKGDFLASAIAQATVDAPADKSLLSLAGEVPVLGEAMDVKFGLAGAGGTDKPKWENGLLALPLSLSVTTKGGPLLKAAGTLKFSVGEADDEGYVRFAPGAFALAGGSTELVAHEEYTLPLGNLLKLTIPAGSVFLLSLDPKAPSVAWDADKSRGNTQARITLAVPADESSGQFVFEMERFRIHSAGIDLRGAVRAGSVEMGEAAAFAGPVAVKSVQRAAQPPDAGGAPRPHAIGEVEFKDSRLVYGSLQATAQLPYFDDAVGTLTLMLSQNRGELECAGVLDITGLDEFHIDALFTTVQVDHLQFGVRYASDGWSSRAAMTGRIKFQPPPGRSAGEMGLISSLFEGVTLDFEDLDPIRGAGSWTLTTPPKRFTIADILLVDLRGLEIGLKGAGGDREVTGCRLIGDLTIQELPGIDASLTFGGVKLDVNGPTPTVTISRIAADFSAPGGFHMRGELENISTDEEVGFAGGFTLKIDALPELGGMLKLTEVRLENGKRAPSVALFVEYAKEVSLIYGFYLRRLGIGVGVRQALRGLEPGAPRQKRLTQFVDNPAGLPDPIFTGSWRPVTRNSLSWMLVGAGLITFGNLPSDKPHLIAGSLLLALDQDLRLTLGSNLWLFTSPNETRDAEFLQRPVARGAMELSVRDGYLKAYVRTIKNPRLGKDAPALLATVLNTVQTSLFFQVDRNGFVVEVGWPLETRINLPKLGDLFHGTLLTGYRYGVYRGVLLYGLNYAIMLRLEASESMSFGVRGASADAGVEVRGEADFRASFVGALDIESWNGYLLGDVRLDAQVHVSVSVNVRIKIAKFIKIRIHFSATLNIVISAALTAAMQASPQKAIGAALAAVTGMGDDVGFRGSARVAISVCGYGISGSANFKSNEDVIERVQAELAKLLPPSPNEAPSGAPGMVLGAETPRLPLWHYRFRWLEPVEDGARPRLRLLLFPAAETAYPDPYREDDQLEFVLRLKAGSKARFAGFVGGERAADPDATDLDWVQNLDAPLQQGSPAEFEQDKQEARAALEARLAELAAKAQDTLTEAEKAERTEAQAALTDLDAALTRTIKDLLDDLSGGHPLDGEVLDHRSAPDYDKRLAEASAQLTPDENAPDSQLGLLLAELLGLLRDTDAAPGAAAAGYSAAPQMQLVLEFDAEPEWRRRRDPVPELIDLSRSHTLAGTEARLESVLGRDVPPVEYDLIPLPVNQEPGRIGLAWEFVREDEVQGARQGAAANGFAPYAELEEYVITRINLSRPGERPRLVAAQPSWIIQEESGGRRFYLRPPYQFIDDAMGKVEEGDILQYRVEARAPDRLLASTLINVTRRTVRPLPTVGQTLALHKVQGNAQSLLLIVPAWETDGPGDSPAEAAAEMSSQLRIRYRRVPAARFGAYGYDLRPISPMRWVDGLPARRDDPTFPKLKFAESSEGRPLPWEETNELTDAAGDPLDLKWEPITRERYDAAKGTMVTEVVGWRCELPAAALPAADDDQAIELHVGRVKRPLVRGDVEERSPLAKCRHAVAAAEPPAGWLRAQSSAADDEGATLDLGHGNSVDAFERLTAQRRRREFLPPAHFQPTVLYPDPTVPELRPEVALIWRHDLSIAAVPAAGPEADPFDPVIGYRIHCFDRYDPGEYPLPREGVRDRTLVSVRATPERLYRATPESIVVEGVPSRPKQTTPGRSVDEEVQTRIQAMQENPGAFHPNWLPVAGPVTVQSVAAAADAGGQEGGRLLWQAGPIFLRSDLRSVLLEICDLLGGARCRIVLHHPLEQRLRSEEPTPEAVRALVAELDARFDARNDPYGWWLAEALGMSCECHFIDADDLPIPAESVRAALVARGMAAAATVSFFHAPDGRTLLNVVRVVVGENNSIALLPALLCRLVKAQPATPAQVAAIPDPVVVGPPVTVKLLWEHNPDPATVALPPRWQASLQPAAAPTLCELRHQVHPLDSDAPVEAPVAGIELPIAADGTLTYRWQLPDQWAHRYLIAVEVVRRHDALRHLLRAEQTGAPEQRGAPEQAIPEERLKELCVERTRPLVQHNLIATPLPGSIQALVYRHPAAFAAAASAVNATHGQYAGQTVILERRIAQRTDLVKHYMPEGVIWATYQPHDTPVADAPTIWPGAPGAPQEAPLALTPVSGTEPGIYGVDRYVYPDLPGYYQYRAAVYSSAGRAQSPAAVSPWVDPLYDELRQRPRAMPARGVTFDAGGSVLAVQLPVVHAAYHLREEMRALWRESDEILPELGQRFGDLPDLALVYQLYLRTNPLVAEPTPVYLPLCRLVGPLAKPQPSAGVALNLGFMLESQTAGAVISVTLQPLEVEGDGLRLLWSISANLAAAKDPSLLAGLRTAAEDASPFIAVAVQRRGVWSQLASAASPVA